MTLPLNDEEQALEKITDGVLDRGLGSVWERLAPLSAGAVASGAVIVAAGAVLRRALDPERGRGLRWLGLATLVPLGLWLLAGEADEGAPPQDDDVDREPEPRDAPEVSEP